MVVHPLSEYAVGVHPFDAMGVRRESLDKYRPQFRLGNVRAR